MNVYESPKFASNNRSESLSGNLSKLKLKYIEIQLFNVKANILVSEMYIFWVLVQKIISSRVFQEFTKVGIQIFRIGSYVKTFSCDLVAILDF